MSTWRYTWVSWIAKMFEASSHRDANATSSCTDGMRFMSWAPRYAGVGKITACGLLLPNIPTAPLTFTDDYKLRLAVSCLSTCASWKFGNFDGHISTVDSNHVSSPPEEIYDQFNMEFLQNRLIVTIEGTSVRRYECQEIWCERFSRQETFKIADSKAENESTQHHQQNLLRRQQPKQNNATIR